MEKAALKHLVRIVFALFNAPTWEVRKQIVQSYPDLLLSKVADQVLLRMRVHYRQNPEVCQQITALRQILARCRTEGIESAFAHHPDSPTLPDIVVGPRAQLHRVQSQDELRAVLEKNPELLPALTQETRQVLDRNPRMLALLQFARPEFFEHLYEFISAASWAESQSCLEKYPDLLTEEAEYAMEWFIQQQKDSKAIQVLTEYRRLLRSCRQLGIQQAFAGKTDRFPEPLRDPGGTE